MYPKPKRERMNVMFGNEHSIIFSVCFYFYWPFKRYLCLSMMNRSLFSIKLPMKNVNGRKRVPSLDDDDNK